MRLIKIKIKELENFCSSDLFQKLETKPISPLRLKSYIANPRAKEDDTVLYAFIENEELIAFRSMLPDVFYDDSGTSFRFAWCSGIWVSPSHRGEKLWKPLLEEAMRDWNNQLLFTNYAPIPQALYTKENLFKLALERNGYRLYFKPDFKEIFKNRISNPVFKQLLNLASITAGIIYNIKDKISTIENVRIEEINQLDSECADLMQQHIDSSLFRRGEKELSWIINYPWVTEKKDLTCKYPFSYDDIRYKIKVVKYFNKDTFAGFFIYSIVNRGMKILYHFENNNSMLSSVAPILQIAKINKISHLTVLSPDLSEMIKRKTNIYLFSKPYGSNIYSSFNFSYHNSYVFDGDGDNSFT